MGATGRAHRSAAWTLLLLLTVVFAPLLCGTSGGPAATPAAAPVVTPVSDVAPAPVAAAGPKKCAPHDAPGQGETVPAPATHRGEPLAAPAVTPVPYLSHDPASCALARPPTGPAPATDPCALLPVLRI
ncbi:hypothetical protein [Streptomyces violens]|uniref:hypothetical protein n=1 Tax=Streptomyces violens TaxID=66377 RepID=UPI0004C090BE|nr:hypothetical protein [Streptomyces violens]